MIDFADHLDAFGQEVLSPSMEGIDIFHFEREVAQRV
jgi:hypothetical protein